MAPAASSGGGSLPSGFSVLVSFPDLLLIFEFLFGGLVWILVASSKVPFPMIQGWVMFVSVFCFVATTILLFLYCFGVHGGSASWLLLDMSYHLTAAFLYLSASVLQANATIQTKSQVISSYYESFQHYQENLSAVVFAFVTTLTYVIHSVFSLRRWKSS